MAHNGLMASYVQDVYGLLAEDPRLRFYSTVPPFDDQSIDEQERTAAQLAGKPVLFNQAVWWRWWDLVLTADHYQVQTLHRDVPIVLVNHAIAGSKTFGGRFYRFDHQHMLREDGTPCYTRIFEASTYGVDCGESFCPSLKGRVAAVGDLRADRIRSKMAKRDAIRQQLGFKPSDRVVMIISTWQHLSLMARMGRQIIEQAKAMMQQGPYQFILSIHPNLWQAGGSTQDPVDDYLLAQRRHGLVVIEPGQDWTDHMVASDVAVTDQSSMSVMFAMTQRPMVFIAMDKGTVRDGSPVWQLQQICPTLASPQQLHEKVEQAFAKFSTKVMRQVTKRLCAYPGQAADRIRHELYGVLRLPQPCVDTHHN